jgi:hypothetical protein
MTSFVLCFLLDSQFNLTEKFLSSRVAIYAMRLHRAAGFTNRCPFQPLFALLSAYFFVQAALPVNDSCSLSSNLFLTMNTSTNPPPLVEIDGDSNMNSGLVQTVGSLLFSGHHKWGFLIYRVTYEDDQAWQDFMNILTSTIEDRLKSDPIPANLSA